MPATLRDLFYCRYDPMEAAEPNRPEYNAIYEELEQVEELREQLDIGLEQLRGENWSRLVFVADVPTEGDDTYALLDEIRAIAQDSGTCPTGITSPRASTWPLPSSAAGHAVLRLDAAGII